MKYKIPKTTGKKLIYNSKLLGWIDPDFRNYGLDKAETSRPAEQVRAFTTNTEKTLAEMFTNPEEMYVTQEQILYCVENNLLDKRRYNVFLIKKSDGTFWAVYCYWNSDYEPWYVHAYSIATPHRWYAGYQVCVRDSLNSEPVERPVEPLDLEITEIKLNGKTYRLEQ